MSTDERRIEDAQTLRQILDEIRQALEWADQKGLYDMKLPHAINVRIKNAAHLDDGICKLIRSMFESAGEEPMSKSDVWAYRKHRGFDGVIDVLTNMRHGDVATTRVSELTEEVQRLERRILDHLATIAQLDEKMSDLEVRTSRPGMTHGIVSRLLGVMGTLEIVSSFIFKESENPPRLAAGLLAMTPMMNSRVFAWKEIRDEIRRYDSAIGLEISLADQIRTTFSVPEVRDFFHAAQVLLDDNGSDASVERLLQSVADQKGPLAVLRTVAEIAAQSYGGYDPDGPGLPSGDDDYFAARLNEDGAIRIEVWYIRKWKAFLRWLEGLAQSRILLTIFGRTIYFQTETERAYWVDGMRQMMDHAGGSMHPYWDTSIYWYRCVPVSSIPLQHAGGEACRLGRWDLIKGDGRVREAWIGVIGKTVFIADDEADQPYVRLEKIWQDSWYLRPSGPGGREHSLPMRREGVTK